MKKTLHDNLEILPQIMSVKGRFLSKFYRLDILQKREKKIETW